MAASVAFDYTNLVEVEGGIGGELEKVTPRLEEAASGLLQDPPGFMRLPRTGKFVEASQRVAEEVRASGAKDFIYVGIGGSSLGPAALLRALLHPYHNLLVERGERAGPRVHFAENTDPASLRSILDVVDPSETWVNVVTKSGSTAETMANFLVVRGALVEALGEDGYGERVVLTTDPEEGYLNRIADREGTKTLPIPQDVGGRFSVLTPVGLFPAAVAGLDVDALLRGAARCVNELTEQGANHPALLGAAYHYLMDASHGRNVRVMMPYADSLERFSAWFVQLWAESLGKEGKGSTPHGAVGTTDQHSQVQLFMQGPQDKVVEFIEIEQHPRDLEMPRAYEDLEGVGYLGGHTMAELLNVECDATREALTEAGRPNSTIRLGGVDEEHLGYLMQALEAQTAVAGGLYGVNPYDQPGVEAGKRITYSRMGRPGY